MNFNRLYFKRLFPITCSKVNELVKVFMLKKSTIILCTIALFGLTGCSEYFIRQFMHGPKVCPSDEMNKVVNNTRSLRNVIRGLNREYVVYAFAHMPERTEMITLQSGQVVVADYYQVSRSKICGGPTMFGKERAIYYRDNRVIGVGEEFYTSRIEPYEKRIDEIKRYQYKYL